MLLKAPRRLLPLAPPMALPMAHVPPSSLTTRPNGVRDADATSAPRRPLTITDASRRMSNNHHIPDTHEDVNTEFSGLPHVRTGVVVESPAHPGIGTATTTTRALVRMCTLNSVDCLMCVPVWWWPPCLCLNELETAPPHPHAHEAVH